MPPRPAKKTYADAGRNAATYPNNTPLLQRSAHAAIPQGKQPILSQQNNKRTAKAAAAQHQKDMKKRELVLLVEDTNKAAAEAVDPLAQRNAINAALQAVSGSAVVVANVRLTAKKNLILTTTEQFSADFLLQHTDT